jgi:hypothetical protein
VPTHHDRFGGDPREGVKEFAGQTDVFPRAVAVEDQLAKDGPWEGVDGVDIEEGVGGWTFFEGEIEAVGRADKHGIGREAVAAQADELARARGQDMALQGDGDGKMGRGITAKLTADRAVRRPEQADREVQRREG